MNGPREDRPWLRLWVLWASLVVYGAVAAPVPGVNEPHYLCKARHYWQPDWLNRDFFLASPNAHTVFYATIGSLTNFLSFDQSAWVGRMLAMLVLAWGWTRCGTQIFLTPWATLWSMWIYLALAACGNFSGEWLVGGVEGKVFCYGFLFAAWADIYRRQWLTAAAWVGLAISFHPVVGLWGLLAFLGAAAIETLTCVIRTRSIPQPATVTNCMMGDLDRGTIMLSAMILILLSLPGLVPVIELLREPVSDEIRYQGGYIQVFFRLAHHLDPMMFPMRAYVGYAALLLFWLCSFFWGGRTKPQAAWDRFVAWSVVFAVVGIAVGYGPRPPGQMSYFAERMNLLKFYPFRLADLLVPFAVAVSLTCVLERGFLNAPLIRQSPTRFSCSGAILLCVYLASLGRAYSVSDSNRYSLEDRTDWLDVCHWIDAHLPQDAIVQSPGNSWAFKWFARRAEYVAFKDCPQNAAGIVEWNRRLNYMKQWYVKNYDDEVYTADDLRELKAQTGITHLLVDRIGEIELKPVYRNATFMVFDLGQIDAEPLQ